MTANLRPRTPAPMIATGLFSTSIGGSQAACLLISVCSSRTGGGLVGLVENDREVE
jgi:hypothetical protein